MDESATKQDTNFIFKIKKFDENEKNDLFALK